MSFCHPVAHLAFAAGLVLPAAGAPLVPYVNDFATRTSGVSPSGRWMETAYAPGDLCRPYANYSFRQPYHPSDSVQDGWAMPGGYSSDAVRVTVVDDGGNPGAVVRTTKEVSGVAVVQSLNNEFKTGILRVSVDIRTPDGGFAKNSPRAFLAPIRRAGLDLAGPALSAYAYIGPAFMSDGTSQQLRAILSVNNGSGSTTYIGRTQADNAITAGSWYRYVMTIDLDAGTYTATYADLGTAHPPPPRRPARRPRTSPAGSTA